MPLHVSSTRAYHQEAKIVLYNLWYHQTYRWPSRAPDKYIETHGQQNIKIPILYVADPNGRPV